MTPFDEKRLPDATDLSEPLDYIPSPEDFTPSPPKPRSPLSHFPSPHTAIPALLCYALFWSVSMHDWRLEESRGSWASGESVLEHHEYWRLISALFAHAGIDHLLANSPLFLIFGWFLFAFFGRLAFPFAAILVGALSNLVTIYVYDPKVHLLGASGMLYGMVALWLVFYTRFETLYTVPMRIFRAVGVALILLFPTTFQPTTSYAAHAFGFGIGIVVGLLMIPLISIKRL